MLNFKEIQNLIQNGIIYGLKTSFQDEGQDFNDIISLKRFCDWWHIPLVLKIGGAEAIRDIKDANKLEIGHLVAPMIQSKFALEKFILAVDQYSQVQNLDLSINIETINSINQIDNILQAKNINKLNGIVVGRVDLMNSITGQKYKGNVNSEESFNLVKLVLQKARINNLCTKLGGSISKDSKQFLRRLIDENLLDYFETRNVIFNTKKINLQNFQQLIDIAVNFELEILNSKKIYYQKLFKANDRRVNMLKDRLGYLKIVQNQQRDNICVDFDGVLHNDYLGFHDGTIYGDLIYGSKQALQKLSKRYNIILFTAKAKSDRPIINGKTGVQLVWQWLEKHNIKQYISQITAEKPRAFCYIDDKAIRYQNNNWFDILLKLENK